MKKGSFINALRAARRNGASVSLIVHATERRVPEAILQNLDREGIQATRMGNTHDIPMHNKFVIVQQDEQAHAWLGSYNYNAKSRWLNDELLVRTEERYAVELLARRFRELCEDSIRERGHERCSRRAGSFGEAQGT
jgi:phosphatidylserine/phosphatidylglycerophosphate/cardiolipin synthase-like enzyme